MPGSADVLRELGALGLSIEQIAGVVEIMDRKDDAKRAASRERMRLVRERARTEANAGAQARTDPPKEIPHTPLEITPVSSLRSETGSQDTRAPEPACRIDFDMRWWPLYPHKVGRRAALQAFISARQRAPLIEILDGTTRYVQQKPPDRQWLNPATFLNEDRWNDEPASTEPSIRGGRATRDPHEPLFREIARQFAPGAGDDERPPDADGGPLDRTEGARPDRGGAIELSAAAYRRTG